MLLIFCAEVVAGILGFIYRDKVEAEIKTEVTDQIINKYGIEKDIQLDNNINTLQQRVSTITA